jgi:hypothetical protein
LHLCSLHLFTVSCKRESRGASGEVGPEFFFFSHENVNIERFDTLCKFYGADHCNAMFFFFTSHT